MQKKLMVLSTLTLLGVLVCGNALAQEKILRVKEGLVPTSDKAEQTPKNGLLAASRTADFVLISDRGSFGCSLSVGGTGGAVFEIQSVGIDKTTEYLFYDANDYLHYDIVGTNVEMAVYNYGPYPIYMKVGNGDFEKWVDSSRPVTPLK